MFLEVSMVVLLPFQLLRDIPVRFATQLVILMGMSDGESVRPQAESLWAGSLLNPRFKINSST